jgi:hypothetical protein
MVGHFVSHNHEAMTAFIVMLPSNCCCRDFSSISQICHMWFSVAVTVVVDESVVVSTAHHCCLWWRWWSDTLWATLIWLWLHLFSLFYLQSCHCGDFSAILSISASPQVWSSGWLWPVIYYKVWLGCFWSSIFGSGNSGYRKALWCNSCQCRNLSEGLIAT